MAQGHVYLSTEKEYTEGINERVAANDLQESQFYTFMGKANGFGAEAITAFVTLDSFKKSAGNFALLLCLKDSDLQTAFKVPSIMKDDFWYPSTDKTISVVIHNTVRVFVSKGYFMTYRQDLDLEFLLASESLSYSDSL